MFYLCSKKYCCYDSKSDKHNISGEVFNKRMQKDTGEETMSKYRQDFCDAVSFKSTNRGFKLSNHLFGT